MTLTAEKIARVVKQEAYRNPLDVADVVTAIKRDRAQILRLIEREKEPVVPGMPEASMDFNEGMRWAMFLIAELD